MKTLFQLGFLIFTLLCACKETQNLEDCIDQEIIAFEQRALCANGSSVESYRYQGQTVYVLREGSCGADFQDKVIDAYCNTLGYLGGISGNSEINGEDFGNAQFISILWMQ